MSNTDDPALKKIKGVASRFGKHRADYYGYISALLISTAGKLKFLEIFQNDIQRYSGKPRARISEYWYDAYSSNGGNLASAFEGTLPDDEVAIIRVAQEAGGDALLTAFADVARIAKLTDTVKKESLNTLYAAIVGVAIAIFMAFIFPIISLTALSHAYDFLPLEFWGPKGKSLLGYVDFIKSYAIFMVGVLMVVMWYLYWSLPNLVRPAIREWLDKNIVLYRVNRDLKGALFLATMSTLTRTTLGKTLTLKQSLEIFSSSAKSPWLRWRIDQIVDVTDSTGSIGVEAFNTGLLNEDMFFFLEDMNKANGFTKGFLETGKYVESSILQKIIVQMTFYRWALLLSSLGIALFFFMWQFQVIYEMRGAMSSYLATG
jgi:hypothetical protein